MHKMSYTDNEKIRYTTVNGLNKKRIISIVKILLH